jgi:segregation and condensation protein B
MTTEDVVQSEQVEETASQEHACEMGASQVEPLQTAPHQVEPQQLETAEAESVAQSALPEQSRDDDHTSEKLEAQVSDTVMASQSADEQSTQPQSAEAASEGQQGPQLTQDQKVGLLEALLLASGDPLPISRVEELLLCTKADVLVLAESLKKSYETDTRGLELVNVSSKLQLRTKAVYAEYVRNLIAVKPRKLSQAALETLAVIAYQQPVVKSEVDKIRGVDVAPTIKTLLERKLVKILGYQATVGQPALYGTTEDFLSIFGLTSLAELPSLRDLKALVKEPGEALEVSSEESEEAEDSGEETDSPSPVDAAPAENATPVQ